VKPERPQLSWDMAARRVANGVADEGGRQRDLLPLPVPRADLRHEGPRLSQLSRGTQQRVTQRHAVMERVAESVWALNALHGAEGRTDGQTDGPISDAQHAALGHVSACVDRCKPPVSPIPDQEALRELLRSDARYSGGECTCSRTNAACTAAKAAGSMETATTTAMIICGRAALWTNAARTAAKAGGSSSSFFPTPSPSIVVRRLRLPASPTGCSNIV
jgi:hypothetical protein